MRTILLLETFPGIRRMSEGCWWMRPLIYIVSFSLSFDTLTSCIWKSRGLKCAHFNAFNYSHHSAWQCLKCSLCFEAYASPPDLISSTISCVYDWYQSNRINCVTKKPFFRMWLSQRKDQHQKRLCDLNKPGTLWYPAWCRAELRGCLGVYRNPSLSCLQTAKKPAPQAKTQIF